MKNPFQTTFLFAAAALLAGSGTSSAISILNDSFETATHPGSSNFRTVFTPGSGGSAYYVASSPSTATLVNDASFGSTRALSVVSPPLGYSIISPFGGTISLAAIGDTLTFGFKIRLTNTSATADGPAFRFGIYGSGGTPVTGDSYGAAVGDNDSGYGALLGNVTTPAAGSTIFNEGGTTAGTPILGGGDRAFLGTSVAGPAIAAGNAAAHTITFTITRTSATLMSISYTFDGTTITTTNTAGIRDSFDEIVFGTGYGTTPVSFNIDDVTLDASNFTLIPEPSVTAFSALAAAGLLVRRRRA